MWHGRNFGASSDLWQHFAQWGDDALARETRLRVPRERPDRGDAAGTASASGKYISGDPAVADSNEYNVQINFVGSWNADLRDAFTRCAETISDIILGDIPNVGVRRNSIDDIAITASLGAIDGAGGVLGQAGWSQVRGGSYLPSRGMMEFDSADAAVYQAAGLFDDIVLHEMLHTVGFGTIWSYLGLASGSSFTGAAANAAYPGSDLVPLETDGGSGTAYSHWDEGSALGANELMTGYIDGNNYLSYTTIASLADLGYSTVSGANYVAPWYI
jgi:hypothetical protein